MKKPKYLNRKHSSLYQTVSKLLLTDGKSKSITKSLFSVGDVTFSPQKNMPALYESVYE